MDNVRVAVRLRPFNAREIAWNAKSCIRMDPVKKHTVITDPETGRCCIFTRFCRAYGVNP